MFIFLSVAGCGHSVSSRQKNEGFGVFLGIPRGFGLIENKSPQETKAGAGWVQPNPPVHPLQ